MDWLIKVEFVRPVALPCDIERLSLLGINLTGETRKPLTDKEKAALFLLDFKVKGSTINIYV